MAFPVSSEVDLLLALQEGAAGNGGWQPFLGRLAGLTGARFAVLVTRPSDGGAPGDIAGAMPSGAAAPLDAPALGHLLSDRMRPERIYTPEELADLADGEAGLTVPVALARIGAVSARAMRVAAAEAGSLTLGIFGARAFEAGDGAVLRRLFPFLHAALRTSARIARERTRAEILADVAARAASGWFLLDRAGMVLASWVAPPGVPSALRLVPGAQGERLAFADRAAGPALTTLLDNLGKGPRALRVSEALHLRLARDPRGFALATLHGGGPPPDPALLVDRFGLLPSEARLAAALADGGGPAEAAARLGLTIETARNYAKKVFAKTGARGQADLVRRLLAGGLSR